MFPSELELYLVIENLKFGHSHHCLALLMVLIRNACLLGSIT